MIRLRLLTGCTLLVALLACGGSTGSPSSGVSPSSSAAPSPTPPVTKTLSVPILSIQNFAEGVNEPPSTVHGTADVSIRGECCFDITLTVVNLKPSSTHEANLHFGRDCSDYEPPLFVGPHFTLVADANGNATDTVHYPFPYSRRSYAGTQGWFIDVHITVHGQGILACGNLPLTA